MKKLLVIDNCADCSMARVKYPEGSMRCCWPRKEWPGREMTAQCYGCIPDWCPLEDAEVDNGVS